MKSLIRILKDNISRLIVMKGYFNIAMRVFGEKWVLEVMKALQKGELAKCAIFEQLNTIHKSALNRVLDGMIENCLIKKKMVVKDSKAVEVYIITPYGWTHIKWFNETCRIGKAHGVMMAGRNLKIK